MRPEYPAKKQIPLLRELWKTAFGDGDDFLDPFFDVGFSPHRCRCIADGECVAAALYWFDVTCGGRKFAYLYGVATDPAYRGRGLCRMLIEDTKALLGSTGYQGLLLLPQSDGLRKMYGKMGFHTCTTVSEFSCEAGEKPEAFRIIHKEEFRRLRRKLLPEGGVLQEGAMLDLLDVLAIFFAGEDYVGSGYLEGNALRCHELLGNAGAAPGILRALGCGCGTFRTPGNRQPFAMCCPLTDRNVEPRYLGLPLD